LFKHSNNDCFAYKELQKLLWQHSLPINSPTAWWTCNNTVQQSMSDQAASPCELVRFLWSPCPFH